MTREEKELIRLIIDDIEQHPQYDRYEILARHRDLYRGLNEGYTTCKLRWHLKDFFKKVFHK